MRSSRGTIEEGDTEALGEVIKDRFIPLAREQLADLRELGYPEADEDSLKKLYDDTDEALDKIAENPQRYLEAEADPFEELNERYSSYGFKECGKDS